MQKQTKQIISSSLQVINKLRQMSDTLMAKRLLQSLVKVRPAFYSNMYQMIAEKSTAMGTL